MRKTALIQITIALFLSLIAGVLIFKWMNARLGAQTQDTSAQVVVIVAAKDIAKGEKLTEEFLKQAKYLKESAPAEAYAEIETLKGRVANAPIGTGEAITASRLVGEESFSGVSTTITPGKRAVAVKGNKVLGLSGFVRPGDHVDVLVAMDVQMTGPGDKDKGEESFAKTVLEDIRVIATGSELEPSGDDSETQQVDVYTLEMDSNECERLALAATKGVLYFALRNPAEDTDVRTQGTNIPKLMSSLTIPTAKGKGGTVKPSSVGVEVITGTSRNTVRFVSHD